MLRRLTQGVHLLPAVYKPSASDWFTSFSFPTLRFPQDCRPDYSVRQQNRGCPIWTDGAVMHFSFQDWRFKPLTQPSGNWRTFLDFNQVEIALQATDSCLCLNVRLKCVDGWSRTTAKRFGDSCASVTLHPHSGCRSGNRTHLKMLMRHSPSQTAILHKIGPQGIEPWPAA